MPIPPRPTAAPLPPGFFSGGARLTDGQLEDFLNELEQRVEAVVQEGGGGGVTDVTATSPLTSTGGPTPNIAIPAASGATAGSMSAADFAKLAALPVAADVIRRNGSVPFTGAQSHGDQDITGVKDLTARRLTLDSPGSFDAFAEFRQGASAAVATGNAGRLRYNTDRQLFEVSADTGAYMAVAPGGGFVYEPGGAQGNGVFTSFAALIDAVATMPLGGPEVPVTFSDRFGSPVVVPTGVYNTQGRRMAWRGQKIGLETIVRLDDGVSFTPTAAGEMPVAAFTDDITVESYASSVGSNVRPFEVAVTSADAQAIVCNRGGTFPKGMVDLPPVRVTDTGGGVGIFIALLFAGRIQNGGTQAVEFASVGLNSRVLAIDALAEVEPDSLKTIAGGTVVIQIGSSAVTVSATQPAVTTLTLESVVLTRTQHFVTSSTLHATDVAATVDTTAGVIVLTLPTPTPGRQVLVQKTNTGTNKITLARNGAESINGVAASYDLPGSEIGQIGRWHAFADASGNWWVG